MRIYITGNDGITLCREAPAAVNEGEIMVASSEQLHAARLSGRRSSPSAYDSASDRSAASAARPFPTSRLTAALLFNSSRETGSRRLRFLTDV